MTKTQTKQKSIALGIVLAAIVVGVAAVSITLVGNSVREFKSVYQEKGVQCVDTDGGDNFNTKGMTYIIGRDVKYTDECIGLDPSTGLYLLKEYKCVDYGAHEFGGTGITYSLVDCDKWEECLKGVGACKAKPNPQ